MSLHRRSSGSSISSSEHSVEDLHKFDKSECEDDVHEMNTERALCLFDQFTSSSANDVWLYMKKVFGFDLNKLKLTIPEFDEFKRIALINYLRLQQRAGRLEDPKFLITQLPERIDDWFVESNLTPVIENDRLLWELPADYEEGESEEDTIQSIEKEDSDQIQELKTQIAYLSKKLNDVHQLLTEELPPIDGGSQSNVPYGNRERHIIEEDTSCKDLESCLTISRTNNFHDEDLSVARFFDKDKHYFDSYSHLSIHREMILDIPRTSAYERFLLNASEKIKGKVVLDVGCGSGILSMFCARAKCKLAVGIDAAADTLNVARKILRANNFDEDQIQLIDGKLEDVDLWFDSKQQKRVISVPKGSSPPSSSAQPFYCDIIVSEWMGYALLYESMFCTVIGARDRYLVSDGLIIPSKACIEMWAANFSSALHQDLDIWDSKLYNLDLSLLKPNEGKHLSSPEVVVVDPDSLRSKPFKIVELDLRRITKKELQRIRSPFTLCVNGGEVTSIVLSFYCLFEGPSGIETVTLDTSPLATPTHWRQTVCHLTNADKKRLHIQLPTQKEITFSGFITLAPGSNNSRHLSIVIELDPIQSDNEQIVGATINMFELK